MPAAPSTCLKGAVPNAQQDPKVLPSTPLFALGRGPRSSPHGRPAFGGPKFWSLGQGAQPPHPIQVPPRRSLGNAEDTRSLPRGRPTGRTHGPRGAGEEAGPGGAGAGAEDEGRGLGRGARCSPAKAPTAFLMSSALSKSVIDILQLFERAEQV